MAGEVIAFAGMSDAAVTIHYEVSNLLTRRIPLQLLTDSPCLFGVISKQYQLQINAAIRLAQTYLLACAHMLRLDTNADRMNKIAGNIIYCICSICPVTQQLYKQTTDQVHTCEHFNPPDSLCWATTNPGTH